MSKNADEKRVKILEAAKRRFAHYGMAKTTMAEIAKDLSFSKALLYYYFPDKNSLYSAVMEFIIEEFEEETQKHITGIADTEEAILSLLSKRMEFIKRYYYIIEFTFLSRKEVPQDLERVLISAFEMHRKIIRDIFRKGVENGALKPLNAEECSRLFLFATMGLRMMVMKDLKSNFIPTKADFDYIVGMQKKLAKIFIRGLKD